jgi:hypothetical protein
VALICVLMLAACSSGSDETTGDIGKVVDLASSFGPEFKVTKVDPTGIDPRLLAPQSLPPGVRFDPADCAKFATGLAVPDGLKGNMAAVTAEGAGNRFITIAVETSEEIPLPDPGEGCTKVAFAGPGARGLVEVAESPTIEDARTLGTHRVVQTTVNGKPAAGELYNYVAGFGQYLVIVTANPLVLPDKPVDPVDTQRARDLVVSAVAAIRQS